MQRAPSVNKNRSLMMYTKNDPPGPCRGRTGRSTVRKNLRETRPRGQLIFAKGPNRRRGRPAEKAAGGGQ